MRGCSAVGREHCTAVEAIRWATAIKLALVWLDVGAHLNRARGHSSGRVGDSSAAAEETKFHFHSHWCRSLARSRVRAKVVALP